MEDIDHRRMLERFDTADSDSESDSDDEPIAPRQAFVSTTVSDDGLAIPSQLATQSTFLAPKPVHLFDK